MGLEPGRRIGHYDVTYPLGEGGMDGRFFLAKPNPLPPPDRSHVNLIFNWFDELQRRVPSP